MSVSRTASIQRATNETDVSIELSLNGTGVSSIQTGVPFFDHLLDALVRHARFNLRMVCTGDLDVDDHHTVEDCAIVLGAALDEALADRRGIQRFGYAYAPLDESLARVVVDLSGRVHATVNLELKREAIGDVATENLTHFFVSLASAARCAIHVEVLRGDNDHHKSEAAFKALALALRQAVARDESILSVPSTKGVL